MISVVIETFSGLGFPDQGDALPYLRKLFTNLPDQDTPHDDIKIIITSELNALKEAIPRHFVDEFMVLPGVDGSDNKYGHWYVLHWILSKWFQKVRDEKDLPPWYLKMVKIVPHDANRGNMMCLDVINQLLEC